MTHLRILNESWKCLKFQRNYPRHKISLKFIQNLNCVVGGSNSGVDEDSGLLVYDALWFDEWFLMFWERTVAFLSLGSSSPKRILGLLHPEDGVIRSCGMSVTAHPPTQYNIPKTCCFRPLICCLLPSLELHHICTEWPKKMYTVFTHQYLWNKFKWNFYFRVRV